ncbi:tetratricopeptide repeat protein [Lysinibacillus sp. LZ02]|uniref:tetratricopeptide repeat protein n=1 Tax=Lysinibacillus sp. LZ02 TaxID=3420668 RepID=UPI003D35DC3A
MAGRQINPKLIHALTNQDLATIPLSPTFKYLKGTYVKSITDNREKIISGTPKNEVMLQCKHCNQKGKYNVGTLYINIDEKNENTRKTAQKMQMTGYFRCKHCNTAGEWEDSSELYMMGIAALLTPNLENNFVQFGEMQLFDGTKPKYCTDGEEHLLNKIAAAPNNALLWNKLGNLYSIGARPELAMAAFEKSIEIDPNQTESHFSMANILMDIKDYSNSLHHLHQMILAAEHYKHIEANHLRDLLAHAICSSFIINAESKGRLPALPTQEQLDAIGKDVNLATEQLIAGIELSSDDLTSFYPLAEAFMGKRAQELLK